MMKIGRAAGKGVHECELITIHCDIAKCEQEAITQVHQMLTQITVLQEAQQCVIELGATETQVDTSFEVLHHPSDSTDLNSKLNKMHSKADSSHGNLENLPADPSLKRARGHYPSTCKENNSPTTTKTKDPPVFTH